MLMPSTNDTISSTTEPSDHTIHESGHNGSDRTKKDWERIVSNIFSTSRLVWISSCSRSH